MAGRRVLITGATRGIGEALAAHCLEAGDEVVGCGRTAASISHERYTHCMVDVTDSAAIEALFRDLKRRFEGQSMAEYREAKARFVTRVLDGTFCKVLSWYDNEWGFSNRMRDVALLVGRSLG